MKWEWSRPDVKEPVMASVAARLSMTLSALRTVDKVPDQERRELLRQSHMDVLVTLVKEYMPSGSGFDSGTTLDLDKSSPTKLVFNTSFHHMTEGSYDGWTEHTVTATPTFAGLTLSIGGRNRNDIKDYIYETFDTALSREADDEFVRRIMRETRESYGLIPA